MTFKIAYLVAAMLTFCSGLVVETLVEPSELPAALCFISLLIFILALMWRIHNVPKHQQKEGHHGREDRIPDREDQEAHRQED